MTRATKPLPQKDSQVSKDQTPMTLDSTLSMIEFSLQKELATKAVLLEQLEKQDEKLLGLRHQQAAIKEAIRISKLPAAPKED